MKAILFIIILLFLSFIAFLDGYMIASMYDQIKTHSPLLVLTIPLVMISSGYLFYFFYVWFIKPGIID